MTPDQLDNLRYIQAAVEASGFGEKYAADIEKGIRAGLQEIPLELSWKNFDKGKEMMFWKPVIVENEENPGRYIYMGYQAILKVNDAHLPANERKPPITQLISNYRQAGATPDQSYLLLKGKTVQHREYDNRLKDYRLVYTRLDLDARVPAGENHPIIRANAENVPLGILYGKENIEAKQNQKDLHLKALQEGRDVFVRINPLPDSKNQGPIDAYLRLHLQDDGKNNRTMAMKVLDLDGNEIRQVSVPVKRADITETKGLNSSLSADNMPENVLKMLTEATSASQGMSTGQRKIA